MFTDGVPTSWLKLRAGGVTSDEESRTTDETEYRRRVLEPVGVSVAEVPIVDIREGVVPTPFRSGVQLRITRFMVEGAELNGRNHSINLDAHF